MTTIEIQMHLQGVLINYYNNRLRGCWCASVLEKNILTYYNKMVAMICISLRISRIIFNWRSFSEYRATLYQEINRAYARTTS